MTGKSTPSLVDLIGFNVPALNTNYSGNKTIYTLNGDRKDLESLYRAAKNSEELLHSSIDAVSTLLLAVEMNSPDSINSNNRVGALWLIQELNKVLEKTSDMAWQLERATAEKNENKNEGVK
jgi:hypothetical protein